MEVKKSFATSTYPSQNTDYINSAKHNHIGKQ